VNAEQHDLEQHANRLEKYGQFNLHMDRHLDLGLPQAVR
jgi:hypothetical protein